MHVGLLLLAYFAAAATACRGPVDDGVGDDSVTTEGALTESTPIGTELVTTSAVNFRKGPGTDQPIIRVLAKGTTVVVVHSPNPTGRFYNVRVGTDEGWVSGSYLAPKGVTTTGGDGGGGGGGCMQRKLTFSADDFPSMPAAGSAFVWGANATGGDQFLDPPYSPDFISHAQDAQGRGLLVYAYLEGPCGDTGGVDDGERARCRRIHNAYNQRFAPDTPDTPEARWKPFTMKQLTTSGQVGADYCEIDNLDNAVTIPLNPLLKEVKGLFDSGQAHCRLVLKNVDADAIDSIRADVAPTPADANFIAPFHIFEDDNTAKKPALDAAMKRLKGDGAVTIISTDTNHYGSAFTPDKFLTCK
jgi:hypothetical protein